MRPSRAPHSRSSSVVSLTSTHAAYASSSACSSSKSSQLNVLLDMSSLSAAKALGIRITQLALFRADEVIE